MTDTEIIKALESEIHLAEYVDSDYCSNVNLEIIKSALDLITRQQAEIERLQKEVNLVSIQFQDLQERYKEAQAEIERLQYLLDEEEKKYTICAKHFYKEAIKEFAERLKEKSGKVEMVCSGALVQRDYTISEKTLDNLVKEMMGENND